VSTAITVRDVPDETKEELAARAARSGRSLQEYLRIRLIELAAAPDASDLVSRIHERKAATRTRISVEKILQYRDRDRDRR
jgi:plasmid stability protein